MVVEEAGSEVIGYMVELSEEWCGGESTHRTHALFKGRDKGRANTRR